MRILLVLGVALAGCAGTESSPVSDLENRVVDVVNTTASPAQFYAVNAEKRRLNRERVFEENIAAHSYLTTNFADGSGTCLFDFYAEFANGQRAEAKRFNTCREVSWVLKP